MLKLNQKGALDPIVIILLIVVLAMGGYIGWTLLKSDNETATETPQTTQKEQTNNVESNNQNSDEVEDLTNELFSVSLPSGWQARESTGEIGVDMGRQFAYTNGTHEVLVKVEPGAGRGARADLSWRYNLNDPADSFSITSKDKEVCAEDTGFCDLGNDKLIVFLKKDDAQDKTAVDGYGYYFYYTNSASADVEDALLEDFEAIIESIKISS